MSAVYFFSPRLFVKEKCFEREENVKQFMCKQSKTFSFFLPVVTFFDNVPACRLGCCFFTCKLNRTIFAMSESFIDCCGVFVGRRNKTLHERDNVTKTIFLLSGLLSFEFVNQIHDSFCRASGESLRQLRTT